MTSSNNGDRPQRRTIRLHADAYKRGAAFAITIATHERHHWFALHEALAAHVQKTLVHTATERESKLFAWCIMPDHVHALVEDDNLVELVRLVKGRCVPYARRCDPDRRLWQRSFYDQGLRREESLESAARYILHNPVRAGLVERCEDYPWSGSLVWPAWQSHDWAVGPAQRSGRG